MELSLICPVKHIKHTALLAGRFCVAPIALKHSEYKAYFTNDSIDGYKVILDNGIFEDNKVQDEDYINLARHIQPHVLVVPDTINADVEANYDTALEFIDLTRAADLNASCKVDVEFMHVIQCKKDDDTGFWKTLEHVLLGGAFQWIGICRDAVYNAFAQYTHTEDQELNRLFFATRLQEIFDTTVISGKNPKTFQVWML